MAAAFCTRAGPELPDLDLEVSSLHEPVVARFLQRQTHSDSAESDAQRRELPRVNALRLGVHVSMGSRQAVRAVGTALGLEPPRVNALARLVPLLSSPGAIEQVMAHAPELGIHDLSTQAEPYNTVLRLAGLVLTSRYGTHPQIRETVCGVSRGSPNDDSQAALMIRRLRRRVEARPYPWRLSNLTLVTVPSTGPVDQAASIR